MKISHKLFLTLVGFTAIILLVSLLLARWSFQQGFREFTVGMEQRRLANTAQALVVSYQTAGNNWRLARQQGLNYFMRAPQNNRGPRSPGPGGPRGPRFRPPPPRNDSGPKDFKPGRREPIPPTALYDNASQFVTGSQIPGDRASAIIYPIELDGRRIGELRSLPQPLANNDLALSFIQQQFYTSLGIGGLCLSLAMLIAWWLTRQLLRPIVSLQENIGTLAKGIYKLPVSLARKDELGHLMNDVEQLAVVLDKTREAKNRWFASISHELRTPLTVLIGEIEVLQAGIRPFNTNSLQSLEQEIRLLERLVGDLYQLSLSEIGGLKYTFSDVELSDIIEGVCDALQTQYDDKKLVLRRPEPGEYWCSGDHARLSQLILNLLNNAMLYTDAPGEVSMSLVNDKDNVMLRIEDSAPGVPLSSCEHLFEPLFRMDEARTRKGSGAGLGLAICKNIVTAHQGTITAIPSAKGGLRLDVTLPKTRESV